MNWRVIILFAIVLFLIPMIVGFVFGVTNLLWQGFMSAEVAFWIWQVCAGLGIFGLFLALGRRVKSRRLAHFAAVFALAELGDWIWILVIGGPIGSSLAWSVVIAVLAALALVTTWYQETRLRDNSSGTSTGGIAPRSTGGKHE